MPWKMGPGVGQMRCPCGWGLGGGQKRSMPLGLATFVPESFALGQLVRFQQDVPCSADSEVQAPQRAGVIWCCSTPGSLSPAVGAALCVGLPVPLYHSVSAKHLLSTCLASSLSPATKLHTGLLQTRLRGA